MERIHHAIWNRFDASSSKKPNQQKELEGFE